MTRHAAIRSGRGGRDGRGGYRSPHMATQMSTYGDSAISPSIASTVSETWSAIARKDTFDPEAYISGIVNKKLAEVTQRLDLLSEGLEKVERDRAVAEFDRQAAVFSSRMIMWHTRNSVINKTQSEVESLNREQESLRVMRVNLLQMPHANPSYLMNFP